MGTGSRASARQVADPLELVDAGELSVEEYFSQIRGEVTAGLEDEARALNNAARAHLGRNPWRPRPFRSVITRLRPRSLQTTTLGDEDVWSWPDVRKAIQQSSQDTQRQLDSQRQQIETYLAELALMLDAAHEEALASPLVASALQKKRKLSVEQMLLESVDAEGTEERVSRQDLAWLGDLGRRLEEVGERFSELSRAGSTRDRFGNFTDEAGHA